MRLLSSLTPDTICSVSVSQCDAFPSSSYLWEADCRAPQSKHTFATVSSILYESVALESAEQCRLTLDMLARDQDIARHVRHLTIRPQSKYRSYLTLAENEVASAAVRRTVGSKCLDALVGFRWDADEFPCNDDMWFALRAGCVQVIIWVCDRDTDLVQVPAIAVHWNLARCDASASQQSCACAYCIERIHLFIYS